MRLIDSITFHVWFAFCSGGGGVDVGVTGGGGGGELD
jgi:hypothetical protein